MEDFLRSHSKLLISQKKEWVEVFIDLETKNNYSIINDRNEEIGFVSEDSRGFLATISRLILRSHRPLQIKVLDSAGALLLRMRRPFFFIWSDMYITDASGVELGSAHRKFNLIYKVYELKDKSQSTFATIKSPFWRLWTFPIYNRSNNTIGTISKKWQGIFKEGFTDADSFAIDFGAIDAQGPHKSIVFGTAITIDFDYFENNNGSILGLFD